MWPCLSSPCPQPGFDCSGCADVVGVGVVGAGVDEEGVGVGVRMMRVAVGDCVGVAGVAVGVAVGVGDGAGLGVGVGVGVGVAVGVGEGEGVNVGAGERPAARGDVVGNSAGVTRSGTSATCLGVGLVCDPFREPTPPGGGLARAHPPKTSVIAKAVPSAASRRRLCRLVHRETTNSPRSRQVR